MRRPTRTHSNLGDPDGAAYDRDQPDAGVSRAASSRRCERSLPSAADALAAQLATLDLADSTMMLGTDQNGRLRSQGKREMRAIDALERDVTDPSLTQGTAAVLDKLSAAVLIETRSEAVSPGVSDGDSRAARRRQQTRPRQRRRRLNMQLGRLRLAAECADGCPGFLSGAASALRSWRQP